MNFVTAPLIADLFLLAISAIGRAEVKAGTLGADNISPIDIMVFFLSLAYIAIRYAYFFLTPICRGVKTHTLTILDIALMLLDWSDIWHSRCFSGAVTMVTDYSSTCTLFSSL